MLRRLSSKPFAVVRQATLALIKEVEESSAGSRLVLTGPSGCGKSMLLKQAVEYCAQKDWLTLYIPKAARLVDSTTPYTYDLRSRTYLQPKASSQALKRFLVANSTLLQNLTTSQDVVLEKAMIPAGTPLPKFIQVGLDEQSSSPAILDALFHKIGTQTDYPVLLAIDDFQALYCTSRYRDPHFNSIRPYHLSLPRLLMEYASGKRTLARGTVVGAITDSDPSWRPPLELRTALGIPHGQPVSPYAKRSETVRQYTKGLKPFAVPSQLSLDEAASIFEHWKSGGAFDSPVSDELFLAKYSESSGNPREFVWKGLLSNFDPR
ncbi:37S ribosomal protein S23 mitochondrial [Pleurotus ostreatus]|uniref:Small ribosomal subunit protein mS29 n=1 Tax=Pleurotus ostreatus TaxID=5322 RepID=A0A8H7DSX5_PLEOS|nr:37S ribosomal protein S23 mitochondrial [Pleurotus ostreatus]KAF7430623.1 37S ribosomal protein S23 mitochondrial [Pleurotus ostreatus]